MTMSKGVRQLILLLSVGALANEVSSTVKATSYDYMPTKYAKKVRKGKNGKPLKRWQ